MDIALRISRTPEHGDTGRVGARGDHTTGHHPVIGAAGGRGAIGTAFTGADGCNAGDIRTGKIRDDHGLANGITATWTGAAGVAIHCPCAAAGRTADGKAYGVGPGLGIGMGRVGGCGGKSVAKIPEITDGSCRAGRIEGDIGRVIETGRVGRSREGGDRVRQEFIMQDDGAAAALRAGPATGYTELDLNSSCARSAPRNGETGIGITHHGSAHRNHRINLQGGEGAIARSVGHDAIFHRAELADTDGGAVGIGIGWVCLCLV